MTQNNKRSRILTYTGGNSKGNGTGFSWDNGDIIFGDPLAAMDNRANHKRLARYYREMGGPKRKKK